MIDLLTADYARMLKSYPFIGCLLFCVDFPIVMVVQIKYFEHINRAESLINLIFLFTGILMAVFVSLFVGMEYDDHTMRNKILIGHSRVKIYLSDYLVCLTGGFILQLVYFFTAVITVNVAFKFGMEGGIMMAPDQIMKCQIIGLYITAAYTGMFVFFCLMIRNQAYSTVICLGMAVLMFAGGMAVSQNVAPPLDMLEEMPFMSQSMLNSFRGMAIDTEPKRQIFMIIDDILPACHAYNIRSGMITGRPAINVLSDTIISLGFTIIGLLSFRKKDFV